MLFSQLITKPLFAIFIAVFLTACSEENTVSDVSQDALQHSILPVLEVYKSPTCHCCGKWIAHVEDHGFDTKSHNTNDLSDLKAEKSILPRYQSCHTAVSKEGYVFEGHIPAKYIHKFLQEKPEDAIGLAVPAMPIGSPGMEIGSEFQSYDILLLKADGSAEIYARTNTQEEQYK